MKPLSQLTINRPTPQTDAPHELAAAVNRIEDAGLFSGNYRRGYWSGKVHQAGFVHPDEEVRKLLVTMEEKKTWLASKGERMNCGGWLTNRLADAKAKRG